MTRSVIATAILTFAFLTTGCGGSKGPRSYPVSGTVQFQDKPVTEGNVTFLSKTTGHAGTAALDSEGKFIIKEGLPEGTYVVAVQPPPPAEAGGAPQAAVPKQYANIPGKFRSDTTTTLSADVEKKANNFTFSLSQ